MYAFVHAKCSMTAGHMVTSTAKGRELQALVAPRREARNAAQAPLSEGIDSLLFPLPLCSAVFQFCVTSSVFLYVTWQVQPSRSETDGVATAVLQIFLHALGLSTKASVDSNSA